MQKVYIGLRGDCTSAWNRNPLGYKTDKLHQGQEIPWAENSWRLKEEVITYAYPALTLAFLGALLGTEQWARWSKGSEPPWPFLHPHWWHRWTLDEIFPLHHQGWNHTDNVPMGIAVSWSVPALHRTGKRLSLLSTPYHSQLHCRVARCLN